MAKDDISHFQQGLISRRSDIGRGENPYSRWTSEWVAWLAGWNVGEEKQAIAEQEHLHELPNNSVPG
jgi:hypothetical protein